MGSSDIHYKLISLCGKQVLFTENDVDGKSLSNNFFVYKIKNNNNKDKIGLCLDLKYDILGTIVSKESLSIPSIGKFIDKSDIFILCEDCTVEGYKGYCITFIDLDTGKPRVYKRCKTKNELNAYLHDIYSENSGWTEEELQTISIISNYNHMPLY